MIESYKSERMLFLAIEKLREAKWDPEMRKNFTYITYLDPSLAESLEVTQLLPEEDSMSVNMLGI